MSMEELQNLDLKYIWHPCSQMKDCEELPPIVIKEGHGVYLKDVNDKEYIDVVSSWWCNLIGHTNDTVVDKIKSQLDNLEHVIFANFTHPPIIELCDRLTEYLPKGLNKFNFSDNGSAAVECALKMAFQYHHQIGDTNRKGFMCLSEGYHGETLGALSVGSLDLYSEIYKPMLMDAHHINAPDCYRCPFNKDRENCNIECGEFAKESFKKHGKTTAALIIEPILQGASGMKIYPAKYLNLLRDLCDEYGVLLIADEIATGFGRTGKFFAVNHANISPDIMTISKGLTGGFMPMAATITTEKIYDAFYGDYNSHVAFMHSHTYSGNPLGSSAALGVLDFLEKNKTLERANEFAPILNKMVLEAFEGEEHIGEIRNIGLINALEIVEDKETKKPFDSKLRLGYQIYKKALDYGLLLRPLGDVIYFNPPLIFTEEEARKSIKIMKKAYKEVLG